MKEILAPISIHTTEELFNVDIKQLSQQYKFYLSNLTTLIQPLEFNLSDLTLHLTLRI